MSNKNERRTTDHINSDDAIASTPAKNDSATGAAPPVEPPLEPLESPEPPEPEPEPPDALLDVLGWLPLVVDAVLGAPDVVLGVMSAVELAAKALMYDSSK